MNRNDLQGEGLADVLQGAISRLRGFSKGVRLDLPPTERALMKIYGDQTIIAITVFRAPIHSMLDKVLNVISFNKWSEVKQDNNFDKMFHLYMVLKLSNNHMIRIEKNHVVNISNSFKTESDAEYYDINLNGEKLTVTQLLNNTIDKVGKEQVFKYSPWSNNCQKFCLDILESNGLLTDQSKAFIYQDIAELVKELPSYTKFIGQTTTDIAHRFDIALHGEGLKNKMNKKNKRKNKK